MSKMLTFAEASTERFLASLNSQISSEERNGLGQTRLVGSRPFVWSFVSGVVVQGLTIEDYTPMAPVSRSLLWHEVVQTMSSIDSQL